MRHLSTTLFVLVGLVNFCPLVGVLGADRLEALYGLTIAGDDLLLLMRHRAVLFGLLGGFLLFAAFRPPWRPLAAVAGLVSMLSFVFLALPLSRHGPDVQRVVWADVVSSALLLVALWASSRNRPRERPEA